jgi:hypothetical protein
MNDAMKKAWLEISQMMGEITALELHVFMRTWQMAIQAEREECAKVCDEQAKRSLAAIEKSKRTTDHHIYHAGAQTATWNAAAIRARGQA